jgi:hypothetical protein
MKWRNCLYPINFDKSYRYCQTRITRMTCNTLIAWSCLCSVSLLILHSRRIAFSSGSVLLLWEHSQGGHCMAAHRGRERENMSGRGVRPFPQQPQTAHGTQLSSLFIYLLKQFVPQPGYVWHSGVFFPLTSRIAPGYYIWFFFSIFLLLTRIPSISKYE